jgi:hypothetical protein
MFGNLGKMMKLAGEMKTKLPEMQARLAASEYKGEAARVEQGPSVRAVVNGRMHLLDLTIAPELLADPAVGAQTLGDLVVAAVTAAQEHASDAAQEAMRELTGGMDIPGLTDTP